ncbi:transcriptional regulator domain-containing protein [Chelativorans salis]|uniref:transcriptional regulator domain-containing protein n=1 Tax=Chelativorans salis TaxID=2978478 RepID=UPI003CC565FF
MHRTNDDTGWLEWQEGATYHHTARLTRLGWAWEFLRRNSAFVSVLVLALRQTLLAREGSHLTVVRLHPSFPDLTGWGIRFRQLGRFRRGRILVSPPMPPRAARDRLLVIRDRRDRSWQATL